jgi:hypothetical protein
MMPAFWLINAVLFQLGWFAVLLFNQHAVVILALTLILHFYLSPSRKNDFLVLLLAPIGWLLDYSLFQLSWLGADSAHFPLWLLLLWVSFVLTLNHSLIWLSKQHWLRVSLLGMIGGPLSYMSAIKTGLLTTSLSPLLFVLTFAILWASLLPLLLKTRQVIFKRFSPINRITN